MTIASKPIDLREPIAADAAERDALQELGALLADEALGPLLLVGEQREVALPPTLLLLLRHLVAGLVGDRAVRIETFGPLVSLREAADILGSTHGHVQELLEQGKLSAQEVHLSNMEAERRIRLTDLLAFAREWGKRRHEALRELTRMSEEMGLYDLEDEACPPS